MTKPDSNKIEFHAVVITPKVRLNNAKFNILSAEQDRQAEKFGLLIAHTKKWKVEYAGDNISSRLDLYVFTHNELHDYMESMFKAKLQHMADVQQTLTEEQRELLRDQSERF